MAGDTRGVARDLRFKPILTAVLSVDTSVEKGSGFWRR
jgi:hypothetical protein